MSENPLLVLRQALLTNPTAPVSFFNASGVEVTESMEECRFVKIGSLIFHKDAPTAFKSKRGTGPHYTVEAVGFLFKSPEMREIAYTEYLQLARKCSVGAVSLVDKKDLVAYIETEAEGSTAIDLDAPLVQAYNSFSEASKSGPAIAEQTSRTIDDPLVITTRSLHSRESMFKSSKNFTNILELSRDIFKPLPKEKAEQMSLIDSIRHANVPSSTQSSEPKKPASIPIIVVPAAPTALLTMFNVKEFLLSAKFRTTTEVKQDSSTTKENTILIERVVDGHKKKYQIIDNPARLSLQEWNRVAAVFVHGPSWQFKGWKWENPVDLFENVCGFYLHYDGANVESTVASWNVHKLAISKSKRHLDSTANLKFWEVFDKFVHLKQ